MLIAPLQNIGRILCLGAHADDIEIGCGATILQLLELHPGVVVDWIVFSSNDIRASEAENSAQRFLENAGDHHIEIERFRDGFFPYHGAEIKEYFESLKRRINPDLIFTHYGKDMHQDHRLLAELTWNTYRDHLILEYEIPKYDGGLGSPNCFMPANEVACDRKIKLLLECFASQAGHPWFTECTFKGLMRLRGIECNSPSLLAEAFYVRKLRLG